jgi:hypothetical protein
MGYKNTQRGGTAMDAATSSSLAFLSSELEYASPKLIKPLTSMTHPRDVTVEYGGGFVEFISAYASDYATTGGNQYGLQGTNNTDIPQIQAVVNKGIWQAWNWAVGFTITHIDLERLRTAKRFGQIAPFSLQKLLEDGVQLTWNKALEYVTYRGWMSQPGLINNAIVANSLAPATGTGGLRTWASKAPVLILADVNFLLLQPLIASAYSLDGMADTILIPWSVYSVLMQPMTAAGDKSVLEYLLDNNIGKQNGIDLKIFPLANDWIATAGTGATTRAVAYRNNEDTVVLRAPQPASKVFTVPTTKDGGAYETIFNGCIGQVQFYRSQTFYYLDGI